MQYVVDNIGILKQQTEGIHGKRLHYGIITTGSLITTALVRSKKKSDVNVELIIQLS